MGFLGKLVGLGVTLAYEEGKKLLSEKELINQLERMSNKELKAQMRPFADYQLRRIYRKDDYPKRMKKAAQSILIERGTLIFKDDEGRIIVGNVKKDS